MESLRKGSTVNAAIAKSGVSAGLAAIIVDDLKRRGLLTEAGSLCSSGLGMCHGGTSEVAKISCSGCPLVN